MQSERKAEGEETATIVRASITRFRKFNETFWGKEFAIYLMCCSQEVQEYVNLVCSGFLANVSLVIQSYYDMFVRRHMTR